MLLSHQIHVRFLGDLKDFLDPSRRGRRFSYIIKGCPSVKDTLEAIGVPHIAIDMIVVNGKNRGFSYQLKEGDDVRVYPVHYDVKGRKGRHLIVSPAKLHFVADSHLGKLVRHLRLLGFDVRYKKVFPDHAIVRMAVRDRRIVLTRDKGLLKYRRLRWGYWVRSSEPDEQILEVVKRYALLRHLKPFRFCVECNGRIKRVARQKVLTQLPDGIKQYQKKFYRCEQCRHVYWKGSHYQRMMQFISRIKKAHY